MIFVGIKKKCLSRQDTSFATTKVCLSLQNLCRNKIMFDILSRQMFSRDKHTFVTTKDVFRDKSKLVVTKVIMFVPTNMYRDKSFVVTKICLLRQDTFLATKDVFCCDKHMFVLKCVCRDKNHTCGSSSQPYSTGHSACVPRAHEA